MTGQTHRQSNLMLCAVAACLVFGPAAANSQASSQEDGSSLQLRDGTAVHLMLMDDLQGQKLKAKQTVHFKVRQDLIVDSHLVVKTGAEAIGHVESVSKSWLFGKSGKLALAFDYVTSVSGEKIHLRGKSAVKGGKGGALTAVSAMWFGPNASLSVGTTMNAYVDKDQSIKLP